MKQLIDLVQQGVAAHRAGNLDAAQSLYQRVLAADPNQFDALHFLGLIAAQRGDFAEADRMISRALTINSGMADVHSNHARILSALKRPQDALASSDKALSINEQFVDALVHRCNALRDLGRHQEALASIDRALALKPPYAVALAARGNVLAGLGRNEEAVAAYDRAIALNPNYAEALNNRGHALLHLARFEEALACFDRALAIRPGYPEALNNRGRTLQALRRFEEALVCYDGVVAINPQAADAAYNRGIALHELGRFDEAVASYDRALAIQPDFAEALNNRGFSLHEMRRFDQALPCYDRALAVKPDFAEAVMNRGRALAELGRDQEALADYDRALAIRSDYPQAAYNRGLMLHELGRFDEALADYDRALVLAPDFADAGFNRACTRLITGRFDDGWMDYEYRHRVKGPKSPAPPRPAPIWNREPLHDRSIVVYWEQGHGDIIQFVRYLPLLDQRGARVTFLCPKNLSRLLRRLRATIEVTPTCEYSRVFDFQCPLLSLPQKFKTGAATIPSQVPYLAAEPELVARWRERIGSGGFRVGICWQGNPSAPAEKGRSAPLAHFQPLAQVADVRLISVQRINGLDQLERLPQGMPVETFDADFAPDDAFVDVAAMMMSLDLVVTSDTAIAHLAGALGRPTWVALKHVPDWRWLLDREDCPWYPQMRLFRQPERGNWDAVFARIADELRGLAAARG
jgi:tetratricopeptide (TPR) repeat protein